MKFTAEELAEMARVDAEIEASFCLTNAEVARSKALDFEISLSGMEPERRKSILRARAYYAAHRDEVLFRTKVHRAMNLEKAMKREREYWEANREKLNARQRNRRKEYKETLGWRQKAIAEFRKARGYTQKEFSELLKIPYSTLASWECGAVPANWERLGNAMPELAELGGEHHDQDPERRGAGGAVPAQNGGDWERL